MLTAGVATRQRYHHHHVEFFSPVMLVSRENITKIRFPLKQTPTENTSNRKSFGGLPRPPVPGQPPYLTIYNKVAACCSPFLFLHVLPAVFSDQPRFDSLLGRRQLAT